MHPFIIYLIQANIALSLFFILYAVLLKRDTFLHLRRLFFLSVILFSLLYPLITVPLPGGLTDLFSVKTEEAVATVFIGEPSFEIVSVEETAPSRDINWTGICMIIYISITLLFVVRFLIQLISIIRIRVKSEPAEISGIPVYRLRDDITPFSFFNLIFIHTDKHSDAELAQILLHEQTHVRQGHSVDIMLIESLCLLFWWNPFVWLLKREMAMNLEYLADNGVLTRGVNSREYQYHLLRLTYHETAVPIVNNFNVSQLKQRIMMMNQSKSPAYRVGRYLLMLPLVLLFLTANSLYAAQQAPADEERQLFNPAVAASSQDQEHVSTDNRITPEQVQAALQDQSLQQPPPEKKEEVIFVVVENMPEYPGGNGAMMKFIGDSIRYPVEAQQKGIQGRVICNFVVMKDGSISDLQIVRGVDPLLDAEALRVLKLMPDWKPGKQRGQAVNVRYTLPVVFRLSGNESKVIIDELRTNEGDLQVQASVSSNFIFPGEENGLFKFVSSRIKYPVIAQENGGQGLVDASFKVDNTGTITDVKIVSGENAILNKEVLRVINEMPQWVKDKSYLVSGRVTDSDLQPLQGTSIILKGTNMGTITDASGNFRIHVPAKEGSLVFSFIGYKTTEVSLSDIKTGNGAIETKLAVVFRLQGDDTTEPYTGPTPDNAIVVVGYGSKKLPQVNDPR
jgi:TonB family protein